MRPLRSLRRFLRDTRGTFSVEMVFILPMLVWVYIGTFVFFDAYRTQNAALRAANVVADLLSRETTPVNLAYLNGMNGVFDFLAETRFPTAIRVSSVGYNAVTESYVLIASLGTRGRLPLTPAQLREIEDQLPLIDAGDSLILVETWLDFTPAVRLGVEPRVFSHVVPVRPRFAPQLAWAL